MNLRFAGVMSVSSSMFSGDAILNSSIYHAIPDKFWAEWRIVAEFAMVMGRVYMYEKPIKDWR